jgi:hypothetical protein
MQFENFGLTIRGGNEDANGYVVMNHGQQYEVILSNNRPTRCNTALSIDGKEVGVYRIEGRSSITLERPLYDQGHFTFYKQNSVEGQAAHLPLGDVLGLVQAVFTPERQAVPFPFGYEWTQQWPQGMTLGDDDQDAPEPSPAPSPARSYEAGGTGLSGHSQQEFHNAEAITLDEEAKVTMTLRLVAQKREMPRPLPSMRSTPVPPPV